MKSDLFNYDAMDILLGQTQYGPESSVATSW